METIGTTSGNERRKTWGAQARRAPRTIARATAIGAVVVMLAACGHVHSMLGRSGAVRPDPEEFGLGPRVSAQGLYAATLEPGTPLRPRELRTVRAHITNGDGRPVDGAAVTVDGGMPEHNHGLPTRPRVTANPGGGVYEIEGVRFNMGGWWEFKLLIDGPAGPDIVTFNLDL